MKNELKDDNEYNPYDPNRHPEREGKILDTCPACGGTLVLINGKYGTFTGCSHFPKCQYTRSLQKNTATFRIFGARHRYAYALPRKPYKKPTKKGKKK